MPRPKSALLTEGELRLMQVLWDRGRATVGDVVSSLEGRRTPGLQHGADHAAHPRNEGIRAA